MKNYNKTKSTKAQREYLKSICRDLKIKYDGKLMDKIEVEKFIEKHKNEQRNLYIKNNKPFPPTNKQKKFIKAIVRHLGANWEGKTLEDAKKFLQYWSPIFYEHVNKMSESGEWGEHQDNGGYTKEEIDKCVRWEFSI